MRQPLFTDLSKIQFLGNAPGSYSVTLLRLKSGTKYSVALLDSSGLIHPLPFWSEGQALIHAGVPEGDWAKVETKVFIATSLPDAPPGHLFFTRKSRKGVMSGIVVWATEGLLPRVFETTDAALTASKKHYRQESRPRLTAQGAAY